MKHLAFKAHKSQKNQLDQFRVGFKFRGYSSLGKNSMWWKLLQNFQCFGRSSQRQDSRSKEVKSSWTTCFALNFYTFFLIVRKKISIFTCSSKDTSGVWKNIETFLHFFVEIKIEESCLKTTPKNTNLYNSSHAFPRQAFYCIGREYVFFMQSFNCGKLRLHCEPSISLN